MTRRETGKIQFKRNPAEAEGALEALKDAVEQMLMAAGEEPDEDLVCDGMRKALLGEADLHVNLDEEVNYLEIMDASMRIGRLLEADGEDTIVVLGQVLKDDDPEEFYFAGSPAEVRERIRKVEVALRL
jgi:hypothetical protein